MKNLVYLVIFYLTCLTTLAQEIPLGTWRTHYSYQSAKQVVLGQNETYCITDNGLFTLDKATNSLKTLSKIDELSESLIAQAAYHSPSQTLMLAYQNSNIDLIRGGEITEISDILNASVNGSKQIQGIFVFQNLAYLATDFGVVVLEVNRQEIRETYRNLGTSGTNLAIFGATVSQDSVLLATAQGVMIGALSQNLQDFNNWKRFTAVNGLPVQKIKQIVSRQNQVYALTESNLLFKYSHQNQWIQVMTPAHTYTQLSVGNSQILLCRSGKIIALDLNDQITEITQELIVNPQSIVFDTQGKYWIADAQNGLVSNFIGATQAYFPNGTARADSWAVYFGNNQIIGLSGGYNTSYQAQNLNSGFYTFRNGTWTNDNAFDTRFSQTMPNVKDLVSVAYNATDRSWYFGTYGEGILVRKSDGSYETLTASNTPLQTSADGKLRITGITPASDGSIWVVNHSVNTGQKAIHRRKTDGTWQSFNAFNTATQNPLSVLIDFNDFKWIQLSPNRGGGIWVLDNQNNRSRYLNTAGNNGSLPSGNVNTLVQDLEGQIWVGTDRGVTVFYNPSEVFESVVNAITPIFEGRPLLRAEKVNSIAIDGGNQKWIGTDNGVWLFSPDGSSLISAFNTENSPLPSNVIRSLAIHPQTGEVFMATEAGIISYRGTATEGNPQSSNVKVFPNPVRPDFEGLVGISGLSEGANVKITDVSGRLFYETRAEGSTASWNLRDYNGTRAKAGIYLIFSTNADGSQTIVQKIAVVE